MASIESLSRAHFIWYAGGMVSCCPVLAEPDRLAAGWWWTSAEITYSCRPAGRLETRTGPLEDPISPPYTVIYVSPLQAARIKVIDLEAYWLIMISIPGAYGMYCYCYNYDFMVVLNNSIYKLRDWGMGLYTRIYTLNIIMSLYWTLCPWLLLPLVWMVGTTVPCCDTFDPVYTIYCAHTKSETILNHDPYWPSILHKSKSRNPSVCKGTPETSLQVVITRSYLDTAPNLTPSTPALWSLPLNQPTLYTPAIISRRAVPSCSRPDQVRLGLWAGSDIIKGLTRSDGGGRSKGCGGQVRSELGSLH